MLTLKAKSNYNDFVGIKVADFILTITLYIDKCLSLTTAIVSDRFSFEEENIMENNDLISRSVLKEALQKRKNEPNYQHEGEDWRNGLCIAEELIDNAPTVKACYTTRDLPQARTNEMSIKEIIEYLKSIKVSTGISRFKPELIQTAIDNAIIELETIAESEDK